MTDRCLIIAEAGVNHNGSLDMALQLVDAAAEVGADMVKFQTFRATELASQFAPKASYQKRSSDAAESQLDMLRRLEDAGVAAAVLPSLFEEQIEHDEMENHRFRETHANAFAEGNFCN